MKRERDKRLIGKRGNADRKAKLEAHNELVKKWQEEAEVRAAAKAKDDEAAAAKAEADEEAARMKAEQDKLD